MTIDLDKLKEALIEYYGTAMNSGLPMAVIELGDVENASLQKLIQMAQNAGLDLRDFEIEEDLGR